MDDKTRIDKKALTHLRDEIDRLTRDLLYVSCSCKEKTHFDTMKALYVINVLPLYKVADDQESLLRLTDKLKRFEYAFGKSEDCSSRCRNQVINRVDQIWSEYAINEENETMTSVLCSQTQWQSHGSGYITFYKNGTGKVCCSYRFKVLQD